VRVSGTAIPRGGAEPTLSVSRVYPTTTTRITGRSLISEHLPERCLILAQLAQTFQNNSNAIRCMLLKSCGVDTRAGLLHDQAARWLHWGRWRRVVRCRFSHVVDVVRLALCVQGVRPPLIVTVESRQVVCTRERNSRDSVQACES
jgi:hypothetical protein